MTGEAPRVVAIGDSIVYGRKDQEASGWASQVRTWLDRKGPSGSALFNLGIGGETTDDLLKRLLPELEVRSPNLIIIGVGTNDVRREGGPNEPHNVHPDQFRDNVVNILRTANAVAQAWIFQIPVVDELQTMPSDENWYLNEDVDKFNQILERCAKQANSKFLITRREIGPLSAHRLLVDGVHPGTEGHRLLAELVKAEMTSHFNMMVE